MASVQVGSALSAGDVVDLPSPVRRSLDRSGVIGRPVPHSVELSQTGQIRSSPDQKWMKFTATELYVVDRPGFEWSAKMRIGGLGLGRATDTLNHGHGRMHVRLLGMVTVVDAEGPEMDQGALMRWLNETIWFPQVWATETINWSAIDDTSAVAAVVSGQRRVEAEFRFDKEGRVVDFVADRYRQVDDDFVLTTWSTPVTDYGPFEGMELPSGGSAVWKLPESDFEYIQLRVHSITHTATSRA